MNTEADFLRAMAGDPRDNPWSWRSPAGWRRMATRGRRGSATPSSARSWGRGVRIPSRPWLRPSAAGSGWWTLVGRRGRSEGTRWLASVGS
jgi:hypothetical protein